MHLLMAAKGHNDKAAAARKSRKPRLFQNAGSSGHRLLQQFADFCTCIGEGPLVSAIGF